MHTITINNATCNTGHLHVSSLTHSEHRHHQDYKLNYRLHLLVGSAKSLHLTNNKLKCMDNKKTYCCIITRSFHRLVP